MQTTSLSFKKSMRSSIVFVLLLAAVQADVWTPGLIWNKARLMEATTLNVHPIKSGWVSDTSCEVDVTLKRVNTERKYHGIRMGVYSTSRVKGPGGYTFDALFVNQTPQEENPMGVRNLWVGHGKALFDEYFTVEFIDGTYLWYKQPRWNRLRKNGDTWIRGKCQSGGIAGRVLDGPVLYPLVGAAALAQVVPHTLMLALAAGTRVEMLALAQGAGALGGAALQIDAPINGIANNTVYKKYPYEFRITDSTTK